MCMGKPRSYTAVASLLFLSSPLTVFEVEKEGLGDGRFGQLWLLPTSRVLLKLERPARTWEQSGWPGQSFSSLGAQLNLLVRF